MTHVGKIYKPELRMQAACKVARAMVEAICTREGLSAEAWPLVQAEGEGAFRVRVSVAVVGPLAQRLHEQLQQSLSRLPVKMQVTLQ